MDGDVSGLNPKNLPTGTLVRKQQTFGLKPKPHLAGRAQFGKLLEHGADCARDGLIGMEDHLALAFAPKQSYRQTTSEFSPFGFIANGSVQAHAQDVQLGFGHGALESQ